MRRDEIGEERLLAGLRHAGGNLDRLILGGVSRRPLSKDKPAPGDEPMGPEERFYPVDGDYFVLRYAEITTLNVRYIPPDELPSAPGLP